MKYYHTIIRNSFFNKLLKIMHTFDFIGLFLYLAGLIIGLGAVTVIEIHSFLARKSTYWIDATTRTHKVTKPLIWLGFFIALFGAVIFYRNIENINIILPQLIILIPLVLNGLYLTLVISPLMLKKEEKHDTSLVPKNLQTKITISFIISTLTWWVQVMLLVQYLINYRYFFS